MSDNAFARAMNQISAQAEAEQLRELKDQSRQRLFAGVRRAFACLLWAALLACGFYYRVELQQFASEKFFSKSKPGRIDSATSESLKDIQTNAKKRDQALNEITK
jgi:hypothetical protein